MKNYSLLLQASLFGNLGSWIFRLTTAYLIWEYTKSGVWLSLLALSTVVPSLLFSPFAGALADRINIIKTSYWVCLIQFILYAISAFSIIITPNVFVYVIVIVNFLFSFVTSLSLPVHQKIIGKVFDSIKIRKSLTINSLCFNITKALAPLVLLLFIESNIETYLYFFCLITPISMALSTWRFDYPEDCEFKTKSQNNKRILEDIKDAIGFIYQNNQYTLLFASVVSGTIFARSIYDILPMVTEYLLNQPASYFAYISSSLGFFSLLAGISALFKGENIEVKHVIILTFISCLLISSNFVVSNLYYAVITLGLSSFFFVLAGLNTLSYIHQNSPDEYKGKIISLYYMSLLAGASLGTMLYSSLYEINLGQYLWLIPMISIYCIVHTLVLRNRLLKAL